MNTEVPLDGLNKRAVKELAKAIQPNETVKAAVAGRDRMALFLTDHRLIIASGNPILRGHDTMMLSDVGKLSSGMTAVSIQVRGGDHTEFSFWPKGKNRDDAANLVNIYRSMQMETSAGNSAPPQAAPSGGIADELAKLGSLRDQGLLSDAEFEEQKAKLLAA